MQDGKQITEKNATWATQNQSLGDEKWMNSKGNYQVHNCFNLAKQLLIGAVISLYKYIRRANTREGKELFKLNNDSTL